MPITEFARFWKAAKEQAAREMNYAAWCACLPYMDKDHFIPFEQYNDKCTGKNIDTRPASEILAEVEEIRRKARNNGNVII